MVLLDFFRIRPKKRVVKIRHNFGVIFTNPKGGRKALFYGANFIFVLSITYLSYLYWPLGKAVIKYWEIRNDFEPNTSQSTGIENLAIPTPTVTLADNSSFWIQIPKIQAKADIVAGVSASNRDEYLKVLKDDVIAQASNSSLPGAGVGKSTYLFAHSSQQGLSMVRNNAVFYLLGELKNNDVFFIDYHGKIYTYLVYKQEVVNASAVQYLDYTEPDKEIVILQTCWPLGTDWKRLLVMAQRI